MSTDLVILKSKAVEFLFESYQITISISSDYGP